MESDRAKFRQYRLESGRVVEFDSDMVCQLLFELTDELGRPDAFLARELTDGLVFFLSKEIGDQVPSIAELTDLIEKYMRELGHPVLAQRFHTRVGREISTAALAYGHKTPRPQPTIAIPDPLPEPAAIAEIFSDAQLAEYSLMSVFPRDVASMHRDGLLVLAGLSCPFELAGSILDAGAGSDIHEVASRIGAARRHTGLYLAIDSADRLLADSGADCEAHAAEFARIITRAGQETGLAVSVNMNSSFESEAIDGAPGDSLFSQAPLHDGRTDPGRAALALARELNGSSTQILWHLSGRDFQPESADRLRSAVQLAISNPNWEFAFERPRFGTLLAAGLTLERPAVLLVVGIQLLRLARQISAGSFDNYLGKLGSLVRLARSAGHAKFEFLRKHARAEARRGFMLDRARLLVAPLGLEAAVRELTHCPIADEGQGSEAAMAIIERFRESLNNEPRTSLEFCIDGFPPPLDSNRGGDRNAESVSGPTPWDADSVPRAQLKAAAMLQHAAGAGTGQIRIASADPPGVDDVTALLRASWHQLEMHRIHFRFERIQ